MKKILITCGVVILLIAALIPIYEVSYRVYWKNKAYDLANVDLNELESKELTANEHGFYILSPGETYEFQGTKILYYCMTHHNDSICRWDGFIMLNVNNQVYLNNNYEMCSSRLMFTEEPSEKLKVLLANAEKME